MQVRHIQHFASWLMMVGVIVLAGFRAQADDPANGNTPREGGAAEATQVKAEQAADPQAGEDRLIVEDTPATSDAEPAGAFTLNLSEDLLITSPDGEERSERVLQINAEPAGDVLALTLREDDAEVDELGKHWIGVQINDVSPALRAQLNLEKGQGVLIGEVFPDSPASKAGVKQYDILLSIDEQKVGRNEDVLRAIKAADGKELKLTLLRGGSERTVSVTPAERPRRDVVTVAPDVPKDFRRWFQNVQPGDPNLEFNVVKPGAALVLHNLAASMTLPDGLSITVTREGKQPAKITIKQKEREIETTEDKLDELPEDLRRYVEPMLGRPRAALNLRAGPTMRGPSQPGGPPQIRLAQPPRAGQRPQPRVDVLVPAPPGAAPQHMERRIDELERRLDELQRAVRGQDEKKSDE